MIVTAARRADPTERFAAGRIYHEARDPEQRSPNHRRRGPPERASPTPACGGSAVPVGSESRQS